MTLKAPLWDVQATTPNIGQMLHCGFWETVGFRLPILPLTNCGLFSHPVLSLTFLFLKW